MITDKQLEYIMDAKSDDTSACCGGSLYNDLCSSCGEHSGAEEPEEKEPYGINVAHELAGGLTDPSY